MHTTYFGGCGFHLPLFGTAQILRNLIFLINAIDTACLQHTHTNSNPSFVQFAQLCTIDNI